MEPLRKSKSAYKRFSNLVDVSPDKDAGSLESSKQRKKKLSDMLGPQWSKEELERFYESYRKYGKDWRRVAATLRNRSTEMVEALYKTNRAYLSLPEGTASAVGLIAMMTDYYNVLTVRVKTFAQKRRRLEIGSSSRGSATRYPLGMKEEHRQVYDGYKSSKILKPNVVLNWDVIDSYGLRAEFEQLLADPAWLQLLSIEEKIYAEITYSFIATFNIYDEGVSSIDSEVEFLAMGEYRRISMIEFVDAMGLYDFEYLHTDEFRELPCYYPVGVRPGDYWSQLGRGKYSASASKGSHLHRLSWRIMHYIFARSTTGRVESEGVVNARDVFQLWSMKEDKQVNVGVFAASCMRRQSEKSMKAIFVGSWITRILKNLKLFPVREPEDCVGRSVKLTSGPMIGWGYRPGEVIPDTEENQENQAPAPKEPTQEGLGAKLVGGQRDDTSLRVALERLIAEIAYIREQQIRFMRRQESLKNFLKNCFAKLGEELEIDFSSCSSSVDGDVRDAHTQTKDMPAVEEIDDDEDDSNSDETYYAQEHDDD